jgi:hypothetical protein
LNQRGRPKYQRNRAIHELKRGYQPTTNLIKDENGEVLAGSHNTLNRYKNYFCQLLNVLAVNDACIQPSSIEVKIVIEKLKRYK